MNPFEIAVVTWQVAREHPPRPDRDGPRHARSTTPRYRVGGALVRLGLALQRRAAGADRAVPRGA